MSASGACLFRTRAYPGQGLGTFPGKGEVTFPLQGQGRGDVSWVGGRFLGKGSGRFLAMKLQGSSASGVRGFVRFGGFVPSVRRRFLGKGKGRFLGKGEGAFPENVSWARARGRFLGMKLQGVSASGVRRYVRFGGLRFQNEGDPWARARVVSWARARGRFLRNHNKQTCHVSPEPSSRSNFGNRQIYV